MPRIEQDQLFDQKPYADFRPQAGPHGQSRILLNNGRGRLIRYGILGVGAALAEACNRAFSKAPVPDYQATGTPTADIQATQDAAYREGYNAAQTQTARTQTIADLKTQAAGTQQAEANAAAQDTKTATATATKPATGERLDNLDSFLIVPAEVEQGGRPSVEAYLTALIDFSKPELYPSYQDSASYSLPYINKPGMLTENTEENTLLTGAREPGQSLAGLGLQVTNAEVRFISGGQYVLPLTEKAAEALKQTKTVRESTPDGAINDHLVFKQVKLADGRPGLLIPGGRDEDHNVWTPEDNYNRGNILIVLAPTEQGNTDLQIQVDSNANWQAQYSLTSEMADQKGIRANQLISYLLYRSDAQRSEGHGLSAMTSMFRGQNCQGSGCRETDDHGRPLAAMAGIGVYVVQIDPKAHAVDVLASTVLTNSRLLELQV